MMQRFFKTYAVPLGVIVLATILTLLTFVWLGYDLRRFDQQLIGSNEIDTFFNSWLLYQVLENLLHRPMDLGYSTMFYGDANTIAYTSAPYGFALLMLPVYLLSGENFVLTYNLNLLITFPLTAWAAYVLFRYLTGAGRVICTLTALTVAFAPWRFFHLSRPELLPTYASLLGLYCLHQFIDRPRLRWGIGLAVALAFCLITAGYLTMITMIIMGGVTVYATVKDHRWLTRTSLTYLVIAGLVCAVLSAPFLGFRFENPMFRVGQPFHMLQDNSARPLDWFSGGSALYRWASPFGGERGLFLGFIPLGLAVFTWWRRRWLSPAPVERRLGRADIVVLYALLVVIGYLLTLGPSLHLTDEIILPTPYMFLLNVPGFSGFRYIARHIVIVIFGVAILNTFGLHIIEKMLSKRRYLYPLALAAITLGLVLELAPYNGSNDKNVLSQLIRRETGNMLVLPDYYKPSPVYDWLDSLPDDVVVFQYPFGTAENSFKYFAALPYHNQPMINGFASFIPAWRFEIDWNGFPNTETLLALLKRQVRYVLVHFDLLTPEEQQQIRERLAQFMEDSGGLSLVMEADDIMVLELTIAPYVPPE